MPKQGLDIKSSHFQNHLELVVRRQALELSRVGFQKQNPEFFKQITPDSLVRELTRRLRHER